MSHEYPVEFDGHVFVAAATQNHGAQNTAPPKLPPAGETVADYVKLLTGFDADKYLPFKLSDFIPQQRTAETVGLDVSNIEQVTFDDIGGNVAAKRILRRLAYGIQNPQIYKEHGTRAPKGILMYGPPGTGKTLLCKALAHEAAAPFFAVNLEEISSKWYGEAEKNIKKVFTEANAQGEPTIVFIDEIDALAPSREFTQGGPTSRIVSVLLNVLDGITPLNNVTLVGATNHKDGIDSALLRPGRFDRHIPISLPDKSALSEIFTKNCSLAEAQAGKHLFEAINTEAIVGEMDGFSGADVTEIVRRVLDERLDLVLEGEASTGPVTTDELLATLKNYERNAVKQSRQYGFAGRLALARDSNQTA